VLSCDAFLEDDTIFVLHCPLERWVEIQHFVIFPKRGKVKKYTNNLKRTKPKTRHFSQHFIQILERYSTEDDTHGGKNIYTKISRLCF
jgi:hypothetical protein